MLSSGRIAFRRAAGATRVGLVVLALLAAVLVSVASEPGTAAAAGPPSRIITYEVRGLGNGSDLEQFAAQAAETFADPRGWSLGGSVAFVRVPSGGTFTLWLSAPARVPGFGPPCSSLYSCRQGRNVIVNEARWLSGSPAWNASGASLRDYRHMVVNHETGHWISFGHSSCSGGGRPAPVMQQQTISLQGCAPNPWPLDGERRTAAAAFGVAIRYGEPFGMIDEVRPWLRSVRVQGWAIDPDTAAPDVIQITVDGAPSFTLAALGRSDLAAAFPGYGPAHGFDAIIPAAAGSHKVCAFAMNVAGGGGNSFLGCQTVVVGSPFGTVERVQSGPRTARVSGWVIDRDLATPGRVHAYVDDRATLVPAARARTDIGRRFPLYGANHGFDQLIPASPGVHGVCLYGIDVSGPGGDTTLGCRIVTVGGSPFGALDAVRTGPGQVRVTGWVIDRDTAGPGTVHVYVDGVATGLTAAGTRADIGNAHPLYGPGHGYDATISTSPGVHRVCAYGINVDGPGSNTTLGCRNVTVPA